mmetsp:Transcript_136949/g.438139  ORF Transcript_136949/g.438139 Transcript_136949/m.438139 type:complete len:219 (-) Transcript_136949:450-1106(-)
MLSNALFSRCCCTAIEEVEVNFPTSLHEGYATDAVKIFEAPAAAADASKPTLLARTLVADKGCESPKQEPAKVPVLELPIAKPRADGHSSFTGSSAQGRPCTVFMEGADDARPARRVPAMYRICAKERSLIVDLGARKIKCPVDGLEDIYQIADGQEAFPPSAVLATKSEKELESLLYLVYYPDPSNCSGDLETLCFSESSSQGRDDLMEQLKRLSMT